MILSSPNFFSYFNHSLKLNHIHSNYLFHPLKDILNYLTLYSFKIKDADFIYLKIQI